MINIRPTITATLICTLGLAISLVIGVYSTANARLGDIAGNWRVVTIWDVSGTLRSFGMEPKTTFTIDEGGYTQFGKQGMEGLLGNGLCTAPCFVWRINYINQRFDISFLGKGTDRLVMVERNAGSVIVAYRE